jgi:RecA-family ATPase
MNARPNSHTARQAPEPAARPSPHHDSAIKVPPLVGIDGDTIYSTPVKHVCPIVEGFLYPGATIFNGRPKQGKSWLMLQTALGVAGETTIASALKVRQPGRVLYLALEETAARTTRRMRKLTPPTDYLADIAFIYADQVEAASMGGITQIDQYLKTHTDIRLVVIDTLLAFQKLERKPSGDIVQSDYNLIKPLQDIAAHYECAIVVVDHSRKMAGPAIDVVSGTTGKTAAIDAVMSLQRQSDGTNLLTILSREMEEKTYLLQLDNGEDGVHKFGWRMLSAGEEARSSAERREVLQLLAEEPLTSRDIARQTGRRESAVRMMLKRMKDAGQAIKWDDGKWRLTERHS